MNLAVRDSELMATDLVEYLVLKGPPFRTAHETIAQLVQYARDNGKDLKDLELSEYVFHSPSFADDVYSNLDPCQSVKRKTSADRIGISSV